MNALFALTAALSLLGLTSCASTSSCCASTSSCCATGGAKKECCVKAGAECEACAAKKVAPKKS